MIYLGGSCSSENRTLMVEIAKMLRANGADIYCPFELKIENAWDYSQEDWAKMVFDKDVEAIDKANILVMVSAGRVSTAGTNWEQGYAYATGKKIYVFQLTEQKTSLMTYCGCTQFVNTDEQNIVRDIEKTLYEEKNDTKNVCSTVLT